jgi:hypothetical protein
MSPFKDAFTEHQIKRWMRPDAYNFVRSDCALVTNKHTYA